MTTKEKAALMASYEPGQKWQAQGVSTCYPDKWHDCIEEPNWDWLCYNYRRKPEPKLRPYKSIDEIPLDHWFKNKKTNGSWTRPGHVWTSGKTIYVYIEGTSSEPIENLLRDYEHSPKPFGNPLPCGVVEKLC